MTVHFRAATHGTIDLANTHPFECGEGRYAVVHNGIISGLPVRDKTKSDTWHYVDGRIGPMLEALPDLFDTDEFRMMIEAEVGIFNKMVILRDDGAKMFIHGPAGLEHEGLWLSNGFSLPRAGVVRGAWSEFEADYTKDADDYGKYDCATDFTLEELAQCGTEEIEDWCRDYPDLIAQMIEEHFATEYMVGNRGRR